MTTGKTFAEEMGQNALQDNDGTVDYNTKVDGPQTHQIGRDTKQAHEDKTKEHGQRNDRSHNQPRTHIA